MSAGFALAQAAAGMRRMERELRRDRAAKRSARPRGARGQDKGDIKRPLRSDIACCWLCADCGYLEDEATTECTACAQGAVVDLGDHQVADLVRDADERARFEIPGWVPWVTRPLCVVVGVAVTLGASAWEPGPDGWFLLGLVVVGVLWAVLPPHVTRLSHRLRTPRPRRWRLPTAGLNLSPPDAVATVDAMGTLLTAPFSGVECAAYQLGVLFDVPCDNHPPQWALAEARSAPLRLGDVELSVDQLLCDEPLEIVNERDARAAGFDLDSFLRARGLFSSDGSYVLFEAVLLQGSAVRVEFGASGVPRACLRTP